MKNKLIVYLLVLAFLLSFFVFPTSAEPLSPPDTSGAVSVLVYNLDSDSLVFSHECDKLVYPASTVKIMVALIAIEYFSDSPDALETKITIPAEVIRESTGLSMELRRNETLTAKDLLAGMIIAGANDAAYALALAIDGSIDTFISRMNRTANTLGMKDTVFYNVSGLDEAPSTTANDLLILAKKAFENPIYMELAGMARYTVDETSQHTQRTLYTRNYLLSKQTYADYYYEPATGMNAGATDNAGYCIVSSARINNENYLCIVMGAAKFENFKIAKAFFEWSSQAYGYRTVLSKTNILAEISVVLAGASDYITVIPKSDVSCYIPLYLDLSTAVAVETDMYFQKLTAPVKAGLIVGEAIVYVEGKEVARVELITASSLSRDHSEQFSRRLRNFLVSSGFLWTLAITFLCCVAYILIVARMRYLRIVKQIMEVPDEDDDLPPSVSTTPDTNKKENH
ncbi:MAG: D-alanyl-D-alanine carboxypeptidase [Ruminococcaceae bacterium]|nr:D-alanyl-D-alanine carboxypeptidase [Oscillospiraceae bacterium]